MANLLHLQLSSLSSSRLAACARRRYYCIVSRRSFECRASRGGRFRFRAEEELFGDRGFSGFGFGNSNKKKKMPWWWFDDDDYDDFINEEEEDWGMAFEVFRTLSWMLAPIGISLLLGTDSDAGLMALAVPLVQSLLSLVANKVLSRPSVRPIKRSTRNTFSKAKRARQDAKMGGGVDKGGYKSWMVGDADFNTTASRYGGWDDLDKRNEITNEDPLNENVPTNQQSIRNTSRRWRVKEKPLLLRMLIATFPFLSSWTKLLF